MARPIILGVVGDSAAGKTTHHPRARAHARRGPGHARRPRRLPPLRPQAARRARRSRRCTPTRNYMDIMAQHLRHLRAGEPILKPVYQHTDGTFGPPTYVEPHGFAVLEGLLGYHTDELLRPLRRARLPRAARGAAPQVEGRPRLLAARLHDRSGARGARPARARLGRLHPPPAAPRRHGRVVPARRRRQQGARRGPAAAPGPAAPRPLAVRRRRRGGITVEDRGDERRVHIPADVDPTDAAEHRGGGLGADALRPPPAHRAPRRVHRRHGAAPLRVARDRPGARALPPRRPRRRRSRWAATEPAAWLRTRRGRCRRADGARSRRPPARCPPRCPAHARRPRAWTPGRSRRCRRPGRRRAAPSAPVLCASAASGVR